MKDFKGDRSVVTEVMGQDHRGHAPPPKFPLEPVAICQFILQAGEEVYHGADRDGGLEPEDALRIPLLRGPGQVALLCQARSAAVHELGSGRSVWCLSHQVGNPQWNQSLATVAQVSCSRSAAGVQSASPLL